MDSGSAAAGGGGSGVGGGGGSGGAAGGAFVSLACPVLFNRSIEFSLGLCGTAGLMIACVFKDQFLGLVPKPHRRLAWLVTIPPANAAMAPRQVEVSFQLPVQRRPRQAASA